MPPLHEICEGPIEGLRLPVRAWQVLRRESITTIAQLRAVADRIHLFEGIGAKTAQMIRAELARVAALDQGQSPHP
jgi:DNA-directed RNA polymerase alpha subunit